MQGKKPTSIVNGTYEATGNPVGVLGFSDGTYWLDTSSHPSAINSWLSASPAVIDLKAGDICRHKRSGGEYRVICIAAATDSPLDKFCVYTSTDVEKPPVFWVRHMTEMSDGRFEIVKSES